MMSWTKGRKHIMLHDPVSVDMSPSIWAFRPRASRKSQLTPSKSPPLLLWALRFLPRLIGFGFPLCQLGLERPVDLGRGWRRWCSLRGDDMAQLLRHIIDPGRDLNVLSIPLIFHRQRKGVGARGKERVFHRHGCWQVPSRCESWLRSTSY